MNKMNVLLYVQTILWIINVLINVLKIMHIHNQDNIVILLVNIIKMVNINIV